MDYEKAYKDALSRAKDCHVNKKFSELDDNAQQLCEYIFPELAESEDERIRKKIITYLTNDLNNVKQVTPRTNEYDRWLAWLEKQAEPQPYKGNADTMRKNLIKAFKSVGSNRWGGFDVRDIIHWLESKDAIELEKQGEQPKKVSIWKHWKDGIAGNGIDKPIYLIKDCHTYSLSPCLSSECDYIELSELDNLMLEKQGEQKPADSYCKDNCKGFQETGKCFADGGCKAKKEAEQNIEEEFDDFFNLESVIDIVEMYGKGEVDLYGSNVTSELKWLKSLRDRVYWKPTEEQMSCFKQAIDLFKMKVNDDSVLRNLNSLYNDLNKL